LNDEGFFFVAIGSDCLVVRISKMKTNKEQEKLKRLNLVLRTIRNVNQLLVRERNRTRLLQGICDNLIENRGYYNAWIALLNTSGGLVATADAGLGNEFLTMIERIKKGKSPHCCQKAIKRPGVVISEDPLSTCVDCPLSTYYAGKAGMTVRLEFGGNVYGIMTVSIPRELKSDEEEWALFEQVAGDVAFALHDMDIEDKRKLAENSLRESEQRFRDLVENSLMGISIIQDNRIVYQNTEQEKLLGPLPRPIKLTDLDSIHPEDVGKVKEFSRNMTSGNNRTQDIEFRFFPVGNMDSGPDMKWVYCRTSSIEYKGKEAILLTLMDMTRAKELEHLLRIQDKMASLGRVAAGIAHEIRNPLSGINIYLNTLQKIYDRSERLDKVKTIIEHLQSASAKIESVIRRVMDFSKPGEPKFVLTTINEPIEEALQLSAVSMRKRGIKVEKTLSEALPPCYLDPHMIEEVILNLITNAAEAVKNMTGEKTIAVSSSAENKHIVVRISDSGPGVSKNRRDKIFDPFYSTKNGSTGIGLSLSHRIITDHGGSLSVTQSKLGGAEFVIEMPIKNQET
jgi:PAS domain S-box-containing protein